MRNLKVISIYTFALFFSVAITSNSPTSFLSTDNQVLASVANNKISDSIKIACPAYEGNGDINSLVADILKACISSSNQPPTTPNPDTTNFPRNILTLDASFGVGVDEADIVITDAASQYSNSYSLFIDNTVLNDQFIIPVGDQYVITVTEDVPVTFATNSCQQQGNTCTGTMTTSNQSITMVID